MKQEWFLGLSQKITSGYGHDKESRRLMCISCIYCYYDCVYYYVVLLVKYLNKNKLWIKDSISKDMNEYSRGHDEKNNIMVFVTIFKKSEQYQRIFNLYLDIGVNCESILDFKTVQNKHEVMILQSLHQYVPTTNQKYVATFEKLQYGEMYCVLLDFDPRCKTRSEDDTLSVGWSNNRQYFSDSFIYAHPGNIIVTENQVYLHFATSGSVVHVSHERIILLTTISFAKDNNCGSLKSTTNKVKWLISVKTDTTSLTCKIAASMTKELVKEIISHPSPMFCSGLELSTVSKLSVHQKHIHCNCVYLQHDVYKSLSNDSSTTQMVMSRRVGSRYTRITTSTFPASANLCKRLCCAKPKYCCD